MSRSRGRNRQHLLSPAGRAEQHGVTVVPLYVVFGGDRTVPETDITDYDAFFEELRAAEKLPTTSQPSVGDFRAAYEPLLADGARDRLDPHLGWAVGHAGGGAPGQGGARARGQGRRANPGDRLDDRGRWARLHGAGGRQGGAATAGAATQVAAHVTEARARAQDVVRRRHARVPQARRADRRRERVDRVDPEGQADPHRRERDDPGRARAHERRGVRADGRLRPPAPRFGRRRLVRRSTSTRPTSPPRWSSACREVFGAEPTIVSEIGPVLAAHTGPGCSARAACRSASCE